MKRRYVLAVIAIFMVLMGTMMNVKWSHMKADLAGKVFRFHVLANSDREEDQALKMRVKEATLRLVDKPKKEKSAYIII